MLDHIGFSVSNVEASRAFYEQALKPLGIKVVMEVTPEMTGADDSHLASAPTGHFSGLAQIRSHHRAVHVAFTALSRKIVDEFYAAAIAAGGKDNGKPGLRPHYHENYYGAFVFDPDGNNIEAVCHSPK